MARTEINKPRRWPGPSEALSSPAPGSVLRPASSAERTSNRKERKEMKDGLRSIPDLNQCQFSDHFSTVIIFRGVAEKAEYLPTSRPTPVFFSQGFPPPHETPARPFARHLAQPLAGAGHVGALGILEGPQQPLYAQGRGQGGAGGWAWGVGRNPPRWDLVARGSRLTGDNKTKTDGRCRGGGQVEEVTFLFFFWIGPFYFFLKTTLEGKKSLPNPGKPTFNSYLIGTSTKPQPPVIAGGGGMWLQDTAILENVCNGHGGGRIYSAYFPAISPQ